MRLTGVSSLTFADTSDWLLMLCNPQPWFDLRSTAIATVAHYDAPGAAVGLLIAGRLFPFALKNAAVASLLSRRGPMWALSSRPWNGAGFPSGNLSSPAS